MSRSLLVYLNNEEVGILTEKKGKNLSFSYFPTAKLPISLSMPISAQKFNDRMTRSFFENLLPEGQLRDSVGSVYHVSSRNPFSMLSVIGHDCAGAVSLTSKEISIVEDEQPIQIPLDSIKQMLAEGKTGLIYKKGMRLSLAGAQNKTTVRYINDAYYQPTFHFPSTHIIKFDSVFFNNVILNEYFCLKLAKSLGLDVVDATYKTLDGVSYLWIKRYDRVINQNHIERIHQEDFCQITGFTSTQKYEADGGPKLIQLSDIIQTYLTYPAREQLKFMKWIVFNLLIGNCDAHAKNLSIIHHEKEYILSPFYDLVSTVIYDDISRDFSMKVNKKSQIETITQFDVISLFDLFGVNGKQILMLVLNDFRHIVGNAKSLATEELFKDNRTMMLQIVHFIENQFQKLS